MLITDPKRRKIIMAKVKAKVPIDQIIFEEIKQAKAVAKQYRGS